jgi:hypothetical protein
MSVTSMIFYMMCVHFTYIILPPLPSSVVKVCAHENMIGMQPWFKPLLGWEV